MAKPLALVLLCLVQAVVVLDATIVAVALPAIRADLHLSPAGLQWVVTAYALTFGGFLLVAGRAADLLGARRLFRAGLAVFTGASLACGLARSPGVLVAARAVQGLGAAAASPAALALLGRTFADGAERTKAVAAWTAAAAGGGALGWVLGGLLAGGPGWPWVFLVNLGPGAIGVAAAGRVLPRDTPPPSTAGRWARPQLDLAGAAAATAGLGALVLGLSLAERARDITVAAAAALCAAVALLLAFRARQRRAAAPLVPRGALAAPGLARALLGALAVTAASTPAMFLCVLELQEVARRSAVDTGLLLAPFNVAVVAGSVAGARLVARRSPWVALTGGLALLAAGIAALVPLGPASAPAAALLAPLGAMGAGVGCASVGSTAAGAAALDAGRQGVGSGLLATAAQLGNALGPAALILLAAAVAGTGSGTAARIAGDRTAFAVAAAIALAGAAAGALPRPRRRVASCA